MVDVERDIAEGQAALREARAQRQSLEEKRRELGRQADGLASQIAALAGEQQASLYGGVRAVVSAAKDGRVSGFVGTVAELLRVPAHLEAAVEAALGGRLQEVVVERWADAESAISLLKRGGAGRATFLPLDTVRAGNLPSVPRGEGVVGSARELVEYDPELGTMADSLLGRVLIVDDLEAARRTIGALQANSPWTLATLGGEVVRPGGSVTGGSNTRADDTKARGRTILGRERKRRELGSAQDNIQREIKAAEKTLEAAGSRVREAEGAVALGSTQLEEARKRQMAAQVVHVEQQGVLSRLQQELHWRVGLVAETRKGLEALRGLEDEVAARRAELEGQIAPVREALEGIETRLKALGEERAGIRAQMGTGETRIAVMSEGLRNVLQRQGELRQEVVRLERRLGELGGRLQGASREKDELSQRRETLASEVARLAQSLKELEEKVGPSERQVREQEAEVSSIEERQSAAQERLLGSETLHSRASVERQRCMGVLESLRIEVSEELGGGNGAGSDGGSGEGETEAASGAFVHRGAAEWSGDGEPPWVRWEQAAAEEGTAEPGMYVTPEESIELERRVRALKARLSRLGPVNPLAMEEHAALQERHSNLSTQLIDLTTASEALKRVIGELDRTMRDQFAATFVQVNEAFQHYFTTLFSGGTAKLELTNPQDVGASGVELMAQPPGKRMQPLAALSGGERALTSAALLFALLKVRPVPFCVLDEVDAALDESNVTRFRAELQALAAETQAIIITHNRGTVEVADTLYGVSMTGDGASQLLSLKVEAARAS